MVFHGDFTADYSNNNILDNHDSGLTLNALGQETLDMPDVSFVQDATLTRAGMDLVLEGPSGSITIEGYFAAEPAPNLVAPGGETLTPDLVESFVRSPMQYASNNTMTDESPVGEVQEISGEATVIRVDGTVETVTLGTPIFQGDIVETSVDGAVNIVFIDETSFAVSEDARLAIDEYVFDPATESGTTNFSVLKGVFVFTSGLIGRDDPDDVSIDTPVGSIGIRGTIIAGDVNSGEITVVEGAIVLRDFSGNEMTLATQFETAKFNLESGGIDNMGQMSPADVAGKFSSISNVSPGLFSSINDAAQENVSDRPAQDNRNPEGPEGELQEGAADQESAQYNEGEGETAGDPPPPDGEPAGPEGEMVDDGMNTASGEGEGGEMPPPPPPPSDPMQTTQPVTQTTNTTSEPTTTSGTTTATAGSNSEPPPPPPPNNTSGDTNVDPTVYDNPPPPDTFRFVQTSSEVISENDTSGVRVATFRAEHGDVASISLSDVNAHIASKFEVLNIAGADYELRLKSGEYLDWDGLKFDGIDQAKVGVKFIDSNGHQYSQAVNIQLVDVDEAPIHQYEAPPVFFDGAVEGQDWAYHFDKDFHNPDFSDPLTFELGTGTVSTLTNLASTGVLDMANNSGWSFDSTSGHLILHFVDDFTGAQTISIDMHAYDAAGNDTGFKSYTINAYEVNGTIASNVSVSNTVFSVENGVGNIDVTGNNNRFYLDDLYDDSFRLSGGDDNYVYLGDQGNDVRISTAGGGSENNTVVGGFDDDTVLIRDIPNKIYGMDGDDTFVMKLSDTAMITELQDGTDNGFRIDGGHDNAYTSTRGDVLKLEDGGNIDFTLIHDNYIKDIETLDTENALSNTVKLSYSDIIQMTEGHSRLILNMDGNDSLQVVGGASLNKTGTTKAVAGEIYDVYTDGTVTLLVDTDVAAANITGLPT